MSGRTLASAFDAAPTIDTVLYFRVLELSEVNEDKIEIDR